MDFGRGPPEPESKQAPRKSRHALKARAVDRAEATLLASKANQRHGHGVDCVRPTRWWPNTSLISRGYPSPVAEDGAPRRRMGVVLSWVVDRLDYRQVVSLSRGGAVGNEEAEAR
jgi:hypothetical protein